MTDQRPAPPQVSRRHHYIPQFYLRPWISGPQNKLVRFSRPREGVFAVKEVSPSSTGWMDRLYALRDEPPEREDRYEREFFAPVDALASVVRNRMLAGEDRFSEAERLAWSNLVISLVFRNPENVDAMERQLQDAVRATDPASSAARWLRGDNTPAELGEVLALLGTPNGSRRLALNTLVRAISGLRANHTLAAQRWGTLRMDIDTPAVLTSDRPIYWPTGLDHDQFSLMMPIAPKVVFYAVSQVLYSRFAEWSRDSGRVAAFLNNQVVRRARSYVYGFSRAALPFVRERLGIEPPVTLIDIIMPLREAEERRRH